MGRIKICCLGIGKTKVSGEYSVMESTGYESGVISVLMSCRSATIVVVPNFEC